LEAVEKMDVDMEVAQFCKIDHVIVEWVFDALGLFVLESFLYVDCLMLISQHPFFKTSNVTHQ
jgi:hypothetical protein